MLLRGKLIFLSVLLLSINSLAQNDSTIILSEVMFYPSSGPNEFIELYNYSSTDSIDLNGFRIKYYTANADVLINAGKGTLLPPESFALILEGDYTFGTGIYDDLIHGDALILRISDNAFGSSGMANTSDRPLWLISTSGDTLDAYVYSADNSSSYSDEKIELVDDNSKSNWGNSEITNGTPGFRNSISPISLDLEMSELNFSPAISVVGEDVTIISKVKNKGLSVANFYSVEIYDDADFDSTADVGEMIYAESFFNLQPGDSIVTSTVITPTEVADHQIISIVIFNYDENQLNNKLVSSFMVYPQGNNYNDIVINEVMYTPINNEPEWIEIKNNTDGDINIKNWSVSDVLSTPTKNLITAEDVFLEPDEFAVITRDTSFNSSYPEVTAKILFANFGSLNNEEDGIIICDFRNEIIDSLFYNSGWGGTNGFSLERISANEETNESNNWISSLSINRSTPGALNSIEQIPVYQRNTLAINEIMYEPDEDNSEYLEFFNVKDESVNIGGWSIEDESGNTYQLSETTLYIAPNSYFVLAADSLIISKYLLPINVQINIINETSLGLLNSGELILLKDVRGNVIDSVWYSDNWHNENFVFTKNISLERINPYFGSNDADNWSSSADLMGGTPGKQNSIFTTNTNLQANISISPNPFSPDNDGFEDFSIINYNLSQATSQVRIKIFDSKGRLVKTLLNNQASGPSGSVVFDGKDDSGDALRIGIYIIFLEAINEGNGIIETMKTVVVVARQL